MIFKNNIDIYYLPHLPENIYSEVARFIVPCNKIKIWSADFLKLISKFGKDVAIQIEFVVLSKEQIEETYLRKDLLDECSFEIVANGYDSLRVAKMLGKNVILGRFFNKSMFKFPDGISYPKGNLVGFDVIEFLGNGHGIEFPYSKDLIQILKNAGYRVVAVDIDIEIYKKYSNINRDLDIDVYVMQLNFGAIGDNCLYKLLNDGVCNWQNCTKKDNSFQYIYMKDSGIESFGMRFYPIGQLLLWEKIDKS